MGHTSLKYARTYGQKEIETLLGEGAATQWDWHSCFSGVPVL
jgi:hypothetical protein